MIDTIGLNDKTVLDPYRRRIPTSCTWSNAGKWSMRQGDGGGASVDEKEVFNGSRGAEMRRDRRVQEQLAEGRLR